MGHSKADVSPASTLLNYHLTYYLFSMLDVYTVLLRVYKKRLVTT